MTNKANEVRRVRRTNALQTDQPTDKGALSHLKMVRT